MESDPKNVRSARGLDYIEVEVLPPEGTTKQPNETDPYILTGQPDPGHLLCHSRNPDSFWGRADHWPDSYLRRPSDFVNFGGALV